MRSRGMNGHVSCHPLNMVRVSPLESTCDGEVFQVGQKVNHRNFSVPSAWIIETRRGQTALVKVLDLISMHLRLFQLTPATGSQHLLL